SPQDAARDRHPGTDKTGGSSLVRPGTSLWRRPASWPGRLGVPCCCCRISTRGGAMSYARQLLDTYPASASADTGVLAAAIDALSDAAQACTADVDADLSEHNVADMVTCIRLCLHCADICTATAGVVSRPAAYDAGVTRPLLQACVAIARAAATSASGTPGCTSTAGS